MSTPAPRTSGSALAIRTNTRRCVKIPGFDTPPCCSSGLFRLFEGYEFVFADACADFLGVFEVPWAALRVDALDKVDFSVVGALAHGVNTSLIDSYRVERGEYAEVAHFGSRCSPHPRFVCLSATALCSTKRTLTHLSLSSLPTSRRNFRTRTTNSTRLSLHGVSPRTAPLSISTSRPAFSTTNSTPFSHNGSLDTHIHRPNNVKLRRPCRYFRLEVRRLYPRTPKLYLLALQFLWRLA